MVDTVCNELIGVWKRQSIAINNEPAFEDSQVFWVQSASRYGDIRVERPGNAVEPESFAGALEWHDPDLTFHHELDLSGRVAEDTGHLEDMAEDDLYESGSVVIEGNTIRFREHWQRQTRPDPAWEVYESRDSGRLLAIGIRVDDHMLLIAHTRSSGGDYSATYARKINSIWQAQLCIGESFQINEDMASLDTGNNWKLLEQSTRSDYL